MREPDAAQVRAVLVSPNARRAVADGNVGQIIRVVRHGLGWTQADVGRRAGYSQAGISRLEKGTTRIDRDLDVLEHVAAALEIPRQVLGLPTTRQKLDDDDVQRRQFLTGAISLSAMALLPRSIVDAGHVGVADIEDGWRALSRLIELDNAVGGADGYPLSADMARQLLAALNEASFANGAEVALQGLAAATMEHTAWVAYDGGDNDSARRWWLETNHLAEVADIAEPRVTALSAMSLQSSTTRSRAKETLGITNAASRVAAGTSASPTLLSILAAREAVAHAQMNDKAGARTAISNSRKWLDQGRTGEEPAVLNFWGAADLACHETRVALVLGDGRSAERAARRAYESADKATFPRNHTIYAVRLGQVLARTGQLEEAISVTADAVERVDAVRGSRRIVDDLRSSINMLGTHAYKPAQEFSRAARKVLPA